MSHEADPSLQQVGGDEESGERGIPERQAREELYKKSRVCTVSLTGQISVTGQRLVFDRGHAVTRSGSPAGFRL